VAAQALHGPVLEDGHEGSIAGEPFRQATDLTSEITEPTLRKVRWVSPALT
jgi:hypothetical protein